MNNEEVREWMEIADSDFDSAQILNDATRKHYEIICYHCAQAAEKYLKGYLVYHDVVPRKTHDLSFLNNLCIEKDGTFTDIQALCDFLTTFATDTRYPNKYEVTESDVSISLNAVEKIKNFKSILNLRDIISESDDELKTIIKR